jgi:hypothetical protein
MSVTDSITSGKPGFLNNAVAELETIVHQAARDAKPLREFERTVLDYLLALGGRCIDGFIALQGQGDLGPTVNTDDGTLQRSAEPVERRLRTLFGEHRFHAYVYSRGAKRAIELRPIDTRMQLPAGCFSHLFQEFAQVFCVEQAFGPAAEAFDTLFRQKVSVNSLERINQRLGEQAETFVQELPTPPAKDEGELLVMTGDGKGVPMVREHSTPPPAFEKRQHPGNRQMAILAGVYSVDRHPRTATEIVDALFRDAPQQTPPPRPEPVGKVIVGFLTKPDPEALDGALAGDIQAFCWAAEQVRQRQRPGQPLIRLMDGQTSLWDISDICLDDKASPISVLDIIHVAGRVWEAAKIFHGHREHQEAFARDRLERILNGQVGGVIAGLRQQATKHGLSQKDRAAVERICVYFENNRQRMRYDEYLREGYPIATGVIEGACRHLVMDRMCRTGMRWTVPGSQAMLHVRAVYQAGLADKFHAHQAANELRTLHKYRHLLAEYEPPVLCG